jgi:hypothetical protein
VVEVCRVGTLPPTNFETTRIVTGARNHSLWGLVSHSVNLFTDELGTNRLCCITAGINWEIGWGRGKGVSATRHPLPHTHPNPPM